MVTVNSKNAYISKMKCDFICLFGQFISYCPKVLPCQRKFKMNILQQRGMESYPVKTRFSYEICIFYPCCHGNEKMIWVFSLETYFIGFLEPKNVHFDTNFIIIALPEAKILVLLYCCKWWQPF